MLIDGESVAARTQTKRRQILFSERRPGRPAVSRSSFGSTTASFIVVICCISVTMELRHAGLCNGRNRFDGDGYSLT